MAVRLTKEERRDVAAKLRYVAEHGAPEWETIACCIADCLGESDYPLWGNGDKLFDLLANLIEPEYEKTCRVEQELDDEIPDCIVLRCSCGYAFPSWRGYKPPFCTQCGAKVVE